MTRRNSSSLIMPNALSLAEQLEVRNRARVLKALSFHRVLTEVTYYRPDSPSLLQTFIHQFDDVMPDLPAVHAFLGFWGRELREAPINTVRVSCGSLCAVSDFRHGRAEFAFN